MLLIPPIAILILSSFAIFYIIRADKKKRSEIKKDYSKYNRMFYRYDNFFLTRAGIRRLYFRLSELSVYSKKELKAVTVKFYSIALGAFWGINLAGIIMFKDTFTFILFFLFATMVKNILVEKQIDRIHFKLLKQLLDSLSSIRQTYLRLGVIPDSIAEANVGPLLKHAFEDIYMILTAVDGERRLEEFYAATPFKLLQTFSGVCFILNNAGDSKTSNGSSNFIQAMGMMHSEVQLEVQKQILQQAKFGLLEYLPIVPLLAMKGIEAFFISYIPGTAIIYHGPIGYISRVIIVTFAMVGYTTIAKVNSTMAVSKDDRNNVIKKLLQQGSFADFINDILPKKQKIINRKKNLLKRSMSMKDVKYLYAEKVLFSLAAFILSVFFIFFAVELGKDFILRNIREVSLVAGEELSKEDKLIRIQMDEIYMNTHPMMTNNATRNFVDRYLPLLPEFDKSAQVQRLQTKYTSYYNTYFRWWMLLICYGVSLITWFVPERILKSRIRLLKAESSEDVLQLQTVITILMNTSVDTMETLYWLQRQSRTHRNALIDAYHEYPSDPELALYRLKSKVNVPDFKRMVDKLVLTIHQISLADAFSDLISERTHVLRIREITQQAILKKKRSMVSPLALTPIALTAFCYIILPLGILGIKEFLRALEMAGIK